MRLGILPFLLLIVPIVEIVVFILVGNEIGIATTLLLVFVTAILGTILLRIQGLATLRRIRGMFDRGQVPGRELGNGAMILVAGVLLLTPGFVTDAIGFTLFVPTVRDAIWSFLASRIVVVPGRFGKANPTGETAETIVDLEPGEFTANPDSPWKEGNGR